MRHSSREVSGWRWFSDGLRLKGIPMDSDRRECLRLELSCCMKRARKEGLAREWLGVIVKGFWLSPANLGNARAVQDLGVYYFLGW